jgi:hypothetical protein
MMAKPSTRNPHITSISSGPRQFLLARSADVAPRGSVSGQVIAGTVDRERRRVCADEDVTVHPNPQGPTKRAARLPEA